MAAPFLIAGLGNPGPEYAATRHNIGFIFLDHLAHEQGFDFRGTKWPARIASVSLWGSSLLLVKPETYMNRSGLAVGAIAAYYRLAPEQVVVIHDDLDLDLGRVKVTTGSGPAGHNGVQSIIEALGTRDFPRVRIGIGRPPDRMAGKDFVLGRFTADNGPAIDSALETATVAVRLLTEQGVVAAMNHINRRPTSQPS